MITKTKSFYLLCLSMVAFVYVLVVNAWVVDDAYITFRTVENLHNGYGLCWNVGERVQAYTHPLWMLTMSLFYFFTGEVFFTAIVLSFCLSLLAVFIVSWQLTNGFQENIWKPVVLVLALLSSKAFIDYTSSGLENALSYLIAALFFSKFLQHWEAIKDRKVVDITPLLLIASIAFVNRFDTILIYVPALVAIILRSLGFPSRKGVTLAFLALLPAICWLGFSLLYYGFPFPNTSYAKMLCTGFPGSWNLHRGVEHLLHSVFWDRASFLLIAAALFFSLKTRSVPALLSLLGCSLYFMYTVVSAASATHMSGRFFAVPFFIGIYIFVDRLKNPRLGSASALFLVFYLMLSPVSSIKFGTSAYESFPKNRNFLDAKYFVYTEGAALINWRPDKKMPDHDWYRSGEQLRSSDAKVTVSEYEAIGYLGFAAGPEKFIVDRLGLSDPLLARLPATRPMTMEGWKSGHFYREIPEGYLESVASGGNEIKQENLHKYYGKIRTITRGDLFSIHRFKEILLMNLGVYDDLLPTSDNHS